MLEITDEASGLQAWVVVDAIEDGLTVAGLQRTPAEEADEALVEAKRAARDWTLACRAAELDSGGCCILLQDPEDGERAKAEEALGRALDTIDPPVLGLRTGEGFAALAEASERVDPEGTVPARAHAVGVLSGIQAVLWALEGDPRAEGRSVLVRGYGTVARFVAQGLSEQGAQVHVAGDEATREQAQAAGHAVVEADAWTEQAVDVLVPTAGRTIGAEEADRLQARGVCPAAFGVLASPKAGEVLAERGIQHAPGPLVNAGALVEAVLTWQEGDAPRVQDEIDRRIGDVYDRTRRVLADAVDEGTPPEALVRERWG